VPATLVILGAGSDVTSRYVVPGLVQLHRADQLPADLHVVATGREDQSDEEYRDELRRVACDEGCDEPEVDAVLDRVVWAEADATEPDQIGALPVARDGEVVVYLALPPSVFADAIAAIADSPWAERARLAVEKPFGTDRSSAVALNELIDELFDASQVYRVDHVLGLAATRRLHRLLERPVLEELWSGRAVRRVEVVWDETLALEGRAGYYDDTGALVDMLQNHLLQVLAVALAGSVPPGVTLPDARHAVLSGLRARPDTSRRARYSAGEIGGEEIPSYVDEEGVDPAHQTETFARFDLVSDDPRWAGVGLTLRSGKALAADRHCLRAELAGGDEVVVDLQTGAVTLSLGDVTFATTALDGALGPYACMLGDLLDGDQSWFVSAAEAEEQWRIVEPVLDAWRAGRPPLGEYPAGSSEVV
jgi:glucose-6-phosphate 1-dehydrogenase